MGKLPCNALPLRVARLHRTGLVSPCHHPPASSLRPTCPVWLDGPWRRHSLKRRQHHEDAIAARTTGTKQMSVLDFAHLGTIGQVIFVCAQGYPKAGKKKIAKTQKVGAFFLWSHIQWAMRSDRPDPPGGFPASPHARDECRIETSWRIICNNKKSTSNKQ